MFRLELDDPEQADAVAQLVEQRLGGLDAIEAVQAEPEELLDLAATVTVVAAAITFPDEGTELLARAHRFIEELRSLVAGTHGVTRAVIVVSAEEIDLDEVSDAQVAEIASSSA